MNEYYLLWRPDFNLGIKEIDDQHKKIIELINKLNDAFMADAAEGELSAILDEMAEYANYHFKSEEEMFVKYHYPFSEEHIALHNKFIAKVQDFKEKQKLHQPITFRVLGFLRDWLTNHILDADREYVAVIKHEQNIE